MLRRSEGATVEEVASATGWQRHTVRGVFSGTLKKKLGLTIASAKEERGRVYRINGPAMKPSFHEASARRNSGGPSPVPGRGGDREYQPRSADIAKLEGDIIGLVDRSTQDLRLVWRQVHRTEPPPGLSRDLLIRALAHRLQEETHGGTSRAQQRRLQTLAREFEKGSGSSDPGIILRTGTTLVRQWRGHTHTVLVREEGFEL